MGRKGWRKWTLRGRGGAGSAPGRVALGALPALLLLAVQLLGSEPQGRVSRTRD